MTLSSVDRLLVFELVELFPDLKVARVKFTLEMHREALISVTS